MGVQLVTVEEGENVLCPYGPIIKWLCDSVIAKAPRELSVVFPSLVKLAQLVFWDGLGIVENKPWDNFIAGRCGQGSLIVVKGVLVEAWNELLQMNFIWLGHNLLNIQAFDEFIGIVPTGNTIEYDTNNSQLSSLWVLVNKMKLSIIEASIECVLSRGVEVELQ